MTDFDRLASAYITTWNEHDSERRLRLVDELFEPAAPYVDPMATVQGTEAISGLIGAVQDQFPGCAFSQVGPVDGHHDQARFRWGLGTDEQDPLVIGFDVVEIGPRGKIARVLGFLDRVPAAPATAS